MKYDSKLWPLSVGLGAMVLFGVSRSGAASSGAAPAGTAPKAVPPTASSPTTTVPPWAASPPFSRHDFSKPLPNSEPGGREVAILAGGCFWCLEAVFELLPGAIDVVSGYTGGPFDRPSYEQVCSGLTGQAEAIRIVFDPKVVSYGQILDLFWKSHDPTTLNRQGPDIGSQYRSAIYWTTESQRKTAAAAIEAQGKIWEIPIVTELEPAGKFWIAEEYHQDYFRRHPERAYCQVVIAPKVKNSGLGR